VIQPLSAAETRRRMNQWGGAGVPFLFVIDFLAKQPFAVRLADINPNELCYNFNGLTNVSVSTESASQEVVFRKYPVPFSQYKPRFEKVVWHILRGNSFLVNLSLPTPIETNLDLKTIFEGSHAKYRLWWKDHFTCFSPEIFVQIRGNRIASFPMKGTIDASLPQAAQQVLSDQKEAAEHATIVDLIRNDLSLVAQKVWVERYRYLDTLHTNQKTLLQVSSEVAGIMPDNWRETLGDWLFELLPAGSICGAPKPSTLQIIAAAEGYERGYYTGIAGIFDGQNLDSGVLIRFVEQQPDGNLVFKSGGGITARSTAQAEYEELIDKVYLPLVHDNTTLYRNHSGEQWAAL
jgi:para-aminobenzoate synthetase component I